MLEIDHTPRYVGRVSPFGLVDRADDAQPAIQFFPDVELARLFHYRNFFSRKLPHYMKAAQCISRMETALTKEQELIEKLRRVEALFSRTTFDGERVAAANAMDRIRERLRSMEESDPPIEYKFTLRNAWSRRLLVALMRRYDIKPYRYHRQRHTTVMARVPVSFVDETLWPEFNELDKTLQSYLDDITSRVISESIYADHSEAEVRTKPDEGLLLP